MKSNMLQKINSFLNNLFWLKVSEYKDLTKICHQTSKPFENELLDFDDEEINKSFEADNKKWFHNEFVYILKNKTLIEPSNKICIKGFRTLIKESFSNGNDRPSLIKYIYFWLFFKKPIYVEKAILFDGNMGLNYFHFFSDIFNKIWLLEKFEVNSDIPLIIPKEVYEKPYFQYLIQETDIKKRNWIVQDKNQWLKTNFLYLLRPFPYTKAYWEKTVTLINYPKNTTSKKIFLIRSVSAGRNISNISQLTDVLNRYGFEIFDTENLSFIEQVKLFAKAKILISIHGAGNTNIAFSNWSNLKFIEILPSNRLCSHYYWLSKSLGIDYNVIKAGPLDENNSFELSPILLENAILNFQKL